MSVRHPEVDLLHYMDTAFRDEKSVLIGGEQVHILTLRIGQGRDGLRSLQLEFRPPATPFAPRPVTPHRDIDRSKRGGRKSKNSGSRAKALAAVFGKKA